MRTSASLPLLVALLAAPAAAQEAPRLGEPASSPERDRDVVEAALAVWPEAQALYGQRSAGWEEEVAPSYRDWLACGSLGMPRTAARATLASRALADDRVLAARSRCADDLRLRAALRELEAAGAAASARLCAAASALLDDAERVGAASDPRLLPALHRLREVLTGPGARAPEQAAALARLDALLVAIERSAARRAEARLERHRACHEAALRVWPRWVADLAPDSATAPERVLGQLEAWRGRRLLLEGGLRFPGPRHAQYFAVGFRSGQPVAFYLGERMVAAIAAAELAIGHGFTLGDFTLEAVVGEVVGACVVPRQDDSRVPAVREALAAPLLRVVALRAGPFALSLEHGSNFSEVLELADHAGAILPVPEAEPGDGLGHLVATLLALAACGALALLAARRERGSAVTPRAGRGPRGARIGRSSPTLPWIDWRTP